jgi:hypothetical protein
VVLAEELDAAFGGVGEAGQDAQQRGFSGAVAAEQRDALAGVGIES